MDLYEIRLAALLVFLPAAGAEGRRGGVVGTFSDALEDDARVGRVNRARNSASTAFSFFTGGWSSPCCLGGGPRLGRCRLDLELCLDVSLFPTDLVADVDEFAALSLLTDRLVDSVAWEEPLVRDIVWRADATLEPEAVV